MYNALLIPPTVLGAPFRYGSTLLQVSDALYSYVAAELGAEDWAYLKIEQANKVEVVKLIALVAPNLFRVARGVDDTEEQNFGYSATVSSVVSQAGVLDAYPPTLVLRGEGVQIDGGKITYPELVFTVLGASQIVGEGDDLVIGRDEQAYGCCDGNNDPASLGPVPFYLTSRPYPAVARELITFTGSLLSGRLWMLDNEKLTFTASFNTGSTLRTVLQAYPYWPHENLTFTGYMGWKNTDAPSGTDDGALVTILRAYTRWPYEAMTFDGDIIVGSGNYLIKTLISYTYWPYESLQTDATLLNGTLT